MCLGIQELYKFQNFINNFNLSITNHLYTVVVCMFLMETSCTSCWSSDSAPVMIEDGRY